MNTTSRNSKVTFKVEQVPASARNKFKCACAVDGLDMRAVIISFMEQYGDFGMACAQRGESPKQLFAQFMEQLTDDETMSKVA